jgi:hypothetical protein
VAGPLGGVAHRGRAVPHPRGALCPRRPDVDQGRSPTRRARQAGGRRGGHAQSAPRSPPAQRHSCRTPARRRPSASSAPAQRRPVLVAPALERRTTDEGPARRGPRARARRSATASGTPAAGGNGRHEGRGGQIERNASHARWVPGPVVDRGARTTAGRSAAVSAARSCSAVEDAGRRSTHGGQGHSLYSGGLGSTVRPKVDALTPARHAYQATAAVRRPR